MGNVEHVAESRLRISEILDKEIEILGDSKKCIVGGFSQGAFMASIVWKKYKKTLGGLIIHSSSANRGTPVEEAQEFSPVFWSQGLDDCLFLYEHGIYHNMVLDNGKRKFVHVTREGLGHAVDKEIKIQAKTFIEDVMISAKL